jgi:uncharacterized protein DUF222
MRSSWVNRWLSCRFSSIIEHVIEAKFAERVAHALLAELAASITTEMSGPAAAFALPEMLAAVRQGELATCRLLERVDRTGEYSCDGAASTVAYLRNLSGETNPWCSERVQLGRALVDHMPSTAAAWQVGELGLTHASVIRKAISTLEADLAAEIEKALAEAAPHITPGQLADLAAVVKAAAAPEDAEERAAKQRANQKLNISRTFDGMYRLDAWLDTETGAEISAAIDAFTRKRDPNLSILDDPIGARRAEALRQMARHAMAHADSCNGNASPRHSLIVATSYEALANGIGSADIQDHGPITASAARRLACEYNIIPAVLGTNSEVLDLGIPNRLANARQRFHIALRDGGCLFPGCDRPSMGCDAHHREHWLDGGPTAEHNLDSFCIFHHHQVHEGGWNYKIIDAETLEFFPPGGGPPLRSKRRGFLQPDLNKRLHPEPTVRRETPRRT